MNGEVRLGGAGMYEANVASYVWIQVRDLYTVVSVILYLHVSYMDIVKA